MAQFQTFCFLHAWLWIFLVWLFDSREACLPRAHERDALSWGCNSTWSFGASHVTGERVQQKHDGGLRNGFWLPGGDRLLPHHGAGRIRMDGVEDTPWKVLPCLLGPLSPEVSLHRGPDTPGFHGLRYLRYAGWGHPQGWEPRQIRCQPRAEGTRKGWEKITKYQPRLPNQLQK